ncbi:MAG: hypothetical protein VKJ64_17880 [Leptolyngbyaceae bacterium]|nr:hypothetical protein [Leptolyngbyaceae bacterium]
MSGIVQPFAREKSLEDCWASGIGRSPNTAGYKNRSSQARHGRGAIAPIFV